MLKCHCFCDSSSLFCNLRVGGETSKGDVTLESPSCINQGNVGVPFTARIQWTKSIYPTVYNSTWNSIDRMPIVEFVQRNYHCCPYNHCICVQKYLYIGMQLPMFCIGSLEHGQWNYEALWPVLVIKSHGIDNDPLREQSYSQLGVWY